MTQRTHGGADPNGVESITKTTQAAFASALSGPQKFAELASEAMAEWMAFVSRRAKAQAELYNELSHCHDVDAASEMQRRFFTHCSEDYAKEFTQLMNLGRRNMERISNEVVHAADAQKPTLRQAA
jgi:hypothetical protein